MGRAAALCAVYRQTNVAQIIVIAVCCTNSMNCMISKSAALLQQGQKRGKKEFKHSLYIILSSELINMSASAICTWVRAALGKSRLKKCGKCAKSVIRTASKHTGKLIDFNWETYFIRGERDCNKESVGSPLQPISYLHHVILPMQTYIIINNKMKHY